MNKAPIYVLLGTFGLVAWFSDGPGDGQQSAMFSSTSSPDIDAQQRRLAVAQEQNWASSDVVLPREDDGHFYADVTVDGATSRMLVDTGASVIALTGADAEAMGVYWDEGAVQPVAQGASGAVYGVPVRLASVQIGGLEASNVEAVVVPEGLGISLLGQSFLSRIERVEIEPQRMVLGS